ncbi:contactin-associated protein-like 5 [Actinia tenebrosa]|uniref:Contactin-associated protein-like 5 n=1 Tax=Actinia tenebrosa TaxID=6105 RepID=A0A6P8IHC4_ACTTE|nr:contactin-associated protein-like 5 [Actinia tenebrosa]XP_031566176.1 contactin-associated protein-like 5 [Actinia tenebrosa]
MICTPKLFLLLFVFWPVPVQGGQAFNFGGKDFICYDRSLDDLAQDVRNDMLSFKNIYKFHFKTIQPSGIFLFSEGTRGDFISIVLLHCKLRVVIYRQVQKGGTPDELNVVTGNDLCDGNWHVVQLIRNGRKACINVDYSQTCHKIPGQFSLLDVDLHTYVSGIDKTAIKPSRQYRDIHQLPNYRGCLRNVMLNETNILKAALKKRKHIKVYGTLSKRCSGHNLMNVVGFNSGSFLQLETPARRALLLSFHFRTYYENGLLFYSQSALFAKLMLVSGSLELQPYIEDLQEIQHPFKFKIGKDLADGNWHIVNIRINSNGFTLSVDQDEITWKKPKKLRSANLSSFKNIIFGHGLGFKSFIGCLNKIKVNKILINASIGSGLHFGRCPISNLCFPNPCRHDAKCINRVQHFSCDCLGLSYTGRLCSDPLYRSTCQEYVKIGLLRDAMCSVLPNNNISSTPLKVLCSMLGERTAVAVIENGKKSWQKVEQHISYSIGGYLKSDIHYSMNFPNIKAVISGSRRCYQYVAFNWTHSMLNVSGNNLAYWISSSKKNGNPVPIITNGYIRDKSMLPVIAVMFHPDAVDSYYYVGPLKCMGTKKHSKPLPSFVDSRRFLKNVCSPLVQSSNTNSAYSPEDDAKVNTGFMSLEIEKPLEPEESVTSKMTEEPSVSSTEKVAITAIETRKTSHFNIQNKKALPSAQNGNRLSSHTALTERPEFLAALIAVLVLLTLLMGFLCASALNKRKMKAERERTFSLSPRLDNNTDIRRKSVCDEIGLQPESDLWMKVNSCGYDVETGKITYGYDIYRVS